jgi:HprK-related kinase B
MQLDQKGLAAQIAKTYPTSTDLYLKFNGCRIRVSVSDKSIAEALSDYFDSFVVAPQHADIRITVHQADGFEVSETFTPKPPDPGKKKIKEEFIELGEGRIVRKRLTGMHFLFGKGIHLAVGPCLDNLNQVVNFVNNRYIEWQLCRGALLGHAAGVASGDRALAVAGFSGAGKSTLALHLMDRGFQFVSNDRLMIRKNADHLTMYGVAKQPRINPGTALNSRSLSHLVPPAQKREFLKLSKEALWNLEHKYDAPVEKCYGPDRFVLSAGMTDLIILTWRPGQGNLSIEKVQDTGSRTALLEAFMKPTGLFFNPDGACAMPAPSVENYLSFLSGIDVWNFSGGVDFNAAAEKCARLLGETHN